MTSAFDRLGGRTPAEKDAHSVGIPFGSWRPSFCPSRATDADMPLLLNGKVAASPRNRNNGLSHVAAELNRNVGSGLISCR
jgi:hypothetical protein